MKFKKVNYLYFSNYHKERLIKVTNIMKKPMGWKAVYKDVKGYFTFEGVDEIRSYFVLEKDLKKIRGLLK